MFVADSGSVYLLFCLLDELTPDANINFQLQVFVLKLLIVVRKVLIFILKLLHPLEKHVVLFIFWDFPLWGELFYDPLGLVPQVWGGPGGSR